MEQTPQLRLPYIMAAQAQKHVTHNEALRALDAIVQIGVLDDDRTTPPALPAEGDRHIVAAGASSAWAGRDRQIAAYQDGAWAFYTPRSGWMAWLQSNGTLLAFDGADWVAAGGNVALNPITGGLIGINATADTTNRLSLASPATLLNHAGAGHQLKVNKSAMAETASLLFQTGFSGRAEMGLAGDDDFHVKVSPDGANWHDAIVVDRSDGRVSFPNTTFSGMTDHVRTRAGTTQDIFDMADTWNAGGTAFAGIKLDVTDTASASASKLLDLQVGGSSRFSVGKGAAIAAAGYNLTSAGGSPMVDLAATWNLSAGGSYGPALIRAQLTDTQSPPLSRVLDVQNGSGGSIVHIRKDGAYVMANPADANTYVGMKRLGSSLVLFGGPGPAYDKSILFMGVSGTGVGEVVSLQSEATNRLSIESAAAIVHIADNGRFEWESVGTASLDFVGYEAASATGKPFNFNNNGQTPTAADVAYFSTHDRSHKPLAIRYQTTTLAYFDGYGKLVLPNLETTGQSLAGSASDSLLDLATTWNTSGSPAAIKLNVTNTASGGAARLVDLKISGSTSFAVDKNGNTFAKGIYGIGGSAGVFNGIFLQSTHIDIYTQNGTLVNSFHTDGLHTANSACIGWTPAGDPTASLEIKMSRTASGVLGVLDNAGTAHQFLQAKLRTHANAVSETITATHTLTLYDAAGTAYKVAAVAA